MEDFRQTIFDCLPKINMRTLLKNLRFLIKTPKATVRIIDGVLRTWIIGQSRIRNCQLALTFKCNHSCEMCSSNLLLQDKKELTLEQWYIVIGQLKKLGCVHFDLTGGEPTLKGLDFLNKLISCINKKKGLHSLTCHQRHAYKQAMA